MKGLLENASDAVRRAANVSADAVTGAAATALERGDALSQKAATAAAVKQLTLQTETVASEEYAQAFAAFVTARAHVLMRAVEAYEAAGFTREEAIRLAIADAGPKIGLLSIWP
jgi:negative regulator of replication initiation